MQPNPVHSVRLPIVNSDRSSGSLSRPSAEGPRLWTEFWREFHPVGRPYERCHVPGDGRHAVDHHWILFAASLPRDARVIDLGCGAGIVGRLLLKHRTDLHVTGIDFADVPDPNVANLKIQADISMEALPFEDGCFDAAISLFGIEYGKIDETARELGRVLRPGAPFSFLVHHAGSEIVREGNTRRRGLKALLSARMKAVFLAGNGAVIDRHLGKLRTQFPGQPTVQRVCRYLCHHIGLPRDGRNAKWQDLIDGLGPELALLTYLQGSAKSPDEMGGWLGPLLATMKVVRVSILHRPSGAPIAWQVSGVR